MSGSGTNRIVNRRNVLRGLGAATTISLAGCAGGDDSSDGPNGSSDGDVEIDYWMYFGAQEGEEMQTLVDEFNQKDNGITVNAQSVPFPQFLDKLFSAVKSENAPHIASYYGSYGQHLKRVCHPIDEYLSSGTKNEYFDAAWNSLQVEDSTYALPIDIHGKALYTNNDVLEKAGVDPTGDFNQSWEAFKQTAETIKSETNARPFSMLNWKNGQAAFRAFIIAHSQAGGKLFEGEPGNYDVAFDNDRGVETAQLMYDVTGDLGWDHSQLQSKSARVEDFVADELAMFIAGTWSTNNFENENGKIPEDLNFQFHKPFYFPGDGEDVAWAESNSLYFPRNPNHTDAERQAAVEFAEYATQNNTLWAEAGGHLPAATSVANSDKVQSLNLWTEQKTISTMYEMVENGQIQYQPKTSIHLNAPRYWGTLMDMYLHSVEPEQAMTMIADEVQSALDRS
ncbi:extracellular solute-binding protein [Halapricum desulfuricans]|uniref:extracellular solute-binding protein n=1 Tax=Halapricum desulfuricans TaxID=2841257 RepID=UPI001E2CE7E7|nr:extracellular solute-binding protein [Halapricum desulfuricans]